MPESRCRKSSRSCPLTDEEKTIACLICKSQSRLRENLNRFASGGATHPMMAFCAGWSALMGIKAAGGVRTYEDAENMVKAGATGLAPAPG
jgi:deoxyribose-phosphate aldolase